MFEKKKKNKAHKPKRLTWPLKSTSSHCPLYSHHTRSLLKGALMKFTWEPFFGYELYILNTYPHYTGSFGALSEFLLAMNCTACFSRDALDYFSSGALNERSVDSNWRVVAAKEYYYYFYFSFQFSLQKLFSLVFFFLSYDWLSLLLGLGAMFSV